MASSDLNSLNITITADAQPAVNAFGEIGAASETAKTKITQFTSSLTKANTELSSLKTNFDSIAKINSTDLLGLQRAEASMASLQTMANNVANKILNMGGGLSKFSEEYKRSLREAGEYADKIYGKFSQPKHIFALTKRSEEYVDKKLPELLEKLKQDREDRRKIINEERAFLKEKTQASADLLANTKKAFNFNKSDLEGLTKAVSSLKTAFDSIGKGTFAEFEKRIKALEEHIKKNAPTQGNSGGRSGGGGVTGGVTDGSIFHLTGRQAALINAMHKNTAAIERNTDGLTNFGASALVADIGRRMMTMGFEKISTLQKNEARVSAWNLNREQQVMFDMQMKNLYKNNPLISKSDAASMMMAAASSIGHYDPEMVGKTIAQVTKYAQMEKALGYNASNIDDIAKNYYGVAEARQVANDVQKTLETFQTIFRITTTTAGKITVGDIETILRNMGPGAATISDEGLLRLLAYAEQIKVAGKGSAGSAGAGISTVGTNVKMLQLMAMGKASNIHAKRMLAELGLLEDNAYIRVSDGSYVPNYNGQDNNDAAVLTKMLFDNKTKLEYENGVMFNRGELGQVLGKVAIGTLGTFASTGFFDKKMAQTDPVKFVESIVPLIESFTVDRKRRSEYYGKLGQENIGLTDAEFKKMLTKEDIISAMTTFWAKTGLSQRVNTALSTFANPNFIERSKHMMATAMKQKSVDELTDEQLNSGNLNIATLRIQKSIENLLQAFEPLGESIGKIIGWISEFIDSITEWVRNWSRLSMATGGWLIIKTIFAQVEMMINAYDLLNVRHKRTADVVEDESEEVEELNKELKKLLQTIEKLKKDLAAANAAGAGQQNPPAGGAQPPTGSAQPPTGGNAPAGGNGPATPPTGSRGFIATIATTTKKAVEMYRNSMEKIKAIVASAFRFMAGCVNVFGMALIAIDIVSIGIEWLAGFTDFGKKVRSWANSLGNWLQRFFRDIFSGIESEFGKDALEIDANIKKTEKEINDENERWEERNREAKKDKSKAITVKEGQDHVNTIERLEQRKADLENRRKEKSSEVANRKNIYKHGMALSSNVEQIRTNIGIYKKASELNDAYKKYADETNRAKLIAIQQGFDPNNKEQQTEEYKRQIAVRDEAKKAWETKLDEYAKLFQNKDLLNALDEFNKFFANIKSNFVKEDIAQDTIEKIKLQFDLLAPEVKDILIGFFDTKLFDPKNVARLATPENPNAATVFANQMQMQVASNAKGIKPKSKLDITDGTVGGYTEQPIPETMELAKYDLLNSEVTRAKEAISSAFIKTAISDTGEELVSYQDIYQKALNEMELNLVKGKFRRGKGEQPYLRPDRRATEEGTWTINDFDLTMKDPKTGLTALQTVQLQAVAKASQKLADEFKNAEITVTKSIYETAEAMRLTAEQVDDWAIPTEVKQNGTKIKEFDKATARQREKLTRLQNTPVWNDTWQKELNDYDRKRAQERSIKIEQNYENLNLSYKNALKQQTPLGMTAKETDFWNYKTKTDQIKKQYQKVVDDIVSDYKNKMANAYSDAEAERLEAERDGKIEELRRNHLAYMKRLDEEYYISTHQADGAFINQKIEDWRNLDQQMTNLQDEMMEGFVSATEKWLDGDLNSWREYANDVLKIIRNMALKQGMASILGGAIQGVTGGVTNFINGAVGNGYAEGSTMGQWGSNFSGWLGFGGTATTGEQVMNSGGGATAGGLSPFFGSGVGSASGVGTMGTETSGENGDISGQLSGFGASVDKANASMLGLNHTTAKVNETATETQIVGVAANAATTLVGAGMSIFSGEQTSNTISVKAFGMAIQKVTAELVSAWLQLKAMKTTSSMTAMANGGIMTSSGPVALPVNAYASGGIARTAQVAIFGEGRQPEAFVPLPDGRTIPVTITNNAESGVANGNNVVISINVTNNAADGTTTESSESTNTTDEDTSNMKKLANNIKSLVKQEIYNQSRPGGLLYNGK